MDWMYKDPKSADPEEYLLGRVITKSHFRDTSPVNYMRSIKNEPESSRNQVDMSRKMLEDPLTIIRQKEIERRRFLYQKSQVKHGEKLIPVNNTTLIEPEEKQSKSLEQLIIENLKQLPFDIDLEKFYNNLKEKRKLKKQKKNEKDPRKFRKSRDVEDDSSDEDSSSDFDDVRSNKHIESKLGRDEKIDPRRKRVKDLGHTSKHNARRSSETDYRKDKHKKERFSDEKISHVKKKHRPQENHREKKGNETMRLDLTKRYSVERRRENYREKKGIETMRRDLTKRYSVERRKENYREKKGSETVRRDLKKRYSAERRKSDEASSKHFIYQREYSERPKEKFNPRQKQRLTEEEKEAKRREMMENAVQRDTERQRNIKKYEIEDKRENEKGGKYSEDFARNQLSALMSSENSVEKRIKSNINNIQRNNREMDRNFARRY